MYRNTIGIVGGFGGFATLNFFKRILESFNTGYERDYPRIIMDNNFTMPSRTRALLYDEETEKITKMIAESVRNLLIAGADYIIMVCGTAHWFLEGVYKIVPESKGKIINIIELTGSALQKKNIKNCYVIAAEGTLKVGLYNKYFEKYGINAISPSEKEYPLIRGFIESVKQNSVSENVQDEFFQFAYKGSVNSVQEEDFPCVILGCTELCMLVREEYNRQILFIDPLEIVIKYLKDHLE